MDTLRSVTVLCEPRQAAGSEWLDTRSLHLFFPITLHCVFHPQQEGTLVPRYSNTSWSLLPLSLHSDLWVLGPSLPSLVFDQTVVFKALYSLDDNLSSFHLLKYCCHLLLPCIEQKLAMRKKKLARSWEWMNISILVYTIFNSPHKKRH